MTSQALDRLPPRRLLARLLDAEDLPGTIRRLEPEILHRLVAVCGLEACMEIVAAATPAQLMRVFDLDLWRSDRPGQEERFDADRFAVWLEVLVDAGEALAAEKLAGLDFDFVTAALTRHFLILDQTWHLTRFHPLESSRSFEIGGYTAVARGGDSPDAFLSVLRTLDSNHPDFFARLMARCCRICTDHVDDNGLLYEVISAEEQVVADVDVDREERRERLGFVTPSQAVAFLESSRRIPRGAPAVPSRDPLTAGYFRTIERLAGFGGASTSPGRRSASQVLALPGAGAEPTRLSAIVAQMQFLAGHDEAAYFTRLEELGYLANALTAGCAFNSRRFTPAEAYGAAVAVSNLGLENWPDQWLSCEGTRGSVTRLPEEFLGDHDLVSVFQVGWSTLHERIAVHALRHLNEVLLTLSCRDDEVQQDIVELCDRLQEYEAAGTPWRARDQLDVIAILDTPCWATLVALIDQCPVVPKDAGKAAPARRVLRVSPEFEFISENSQIDWAHAFLDSLAERLATS